MTQENLPCKNCITLSICKIKVKQRFQGMTIYLDNTMQGNMTVNVLRKYCQPVKDFIQGNGYEPYEQYEERLMSVFRYLIKD